MPLTLTPGVALLFLAVLVPVLSWYSLVKDRHEYRVFKTLTASAERRGYFRRWVLRAFLLFTGASLVVLALTGDLAAIIELPAPFAALHDLLQAADQSPEGDVSPGFLAGFIVAIVIGVGALTALLVLQARRKKTKAPIIGDVEALLPRNLAEGVWGVALSVNAGISEELFFRLLLPLLFHALTGDVVIAFALSAILFGLAHAYQGVWGVLLTAVLGVVMSVLYLRTGQLWIPMVAHAVLDLRALVVVPALGALFRRKPEASETT